MSKAIKLILIGAAFTLAGCTTVFGDQGLDKVDGPTLQQKLVDGVTTEAQARALLGDPGNTQLRDNGETEWDYKEESSNYLQTLEAGIGKLDRTKHSVTLLFDKRGVLLRHEMTGY
jgi:hypothetical protein